MAFTRHGHLIPGTTGYENDYPHMVRDCGGPGICVGCSADSLTNPGFVRPEGPSWGFPINAMRASFGFQPAPQVRLTGPESNPDSLVNMLRMWLSRKLDVGPANGSFWCIGCSLNEGRTYIQYTIDTEVMQRHVRQHGPGEFIRLRSAIPALED